MTIGIVLAVGFLTLLIGYALGRTSATEPLPCCCLHTLHHVHDCSYPKCFYRFEYERLSSHNSDLERENKRLSDQYHFMRRELSLASRPIYAQTPKEQEILDLVIKAADPIEQLKDKLGITQTRT